jgi:hypothetical protein
MAILSKAVLYMFSAIPIKILMTFFRDKKINPKVHVDAQKTLNTQSNPESKEQC